jgi:hypothetical protein
LCLSSWLAELTPGCISASGMQTMFAILCNVLRGFAQLPLAPVLADQRDCLIFTALTETLRRCGSGSVILEVHATAPIPETVSVVSLVLAPIFGHQLAIFLERWSEYCAKRPLTADALGAVASMAAYWAPHSVELSTVGLQCLATLAACGAVAQGLGAELLQAADAFVTEGYELMLRETDKERATAAVHMHCSLLVSLWRASMEPLPRDGCLLKQCIRLIDKHCLDAPVFKMVPCMTQGGGLLVRPKPKPMKSAGPRRRPVRTAVAAKRTQSSK